MLVVDDDQENIDLIARAFRNEFEVAQARDGAAALEIARQLRPDVVITDQRMPEKTGVELLMMLKEELPDTIRILVTGHTDYGSLVDAVNTARIHHYVEKPFHTVDLRTIVSALLHSLDLEQANRHLQDLAVRDGLTGLFNHRYFTEHLTIELARCVRYRREATLLFMDLDNFKQVNDNYGHPVGDTVLVHIASLLAPDREGLRRSDFVARYGGEEFVVLLPETSLAGGQIKAERIRRRIEQAKWAEVDPHLVAPVTVSIGVASYPQHGADGDALVGAADAAQYEAKRRGKNCVVCAPTP